MNPCTALCNAMITQRHIAGSFSESARKDAVASSAPTASRSSMNDPANLLSIGEAARRLGVPVSRLRYWANHGYSEDETTE